MGEEQDKFFHRNNIGIFSSELKLGGEITTRLRDDISVKLNYEIKQENESKFSSFITIPFKEIVNGANHYLSPEGINILDSISLPNGQYALSVWYTAETGDITQYDNNNNINYEASFMLNRPSESVKLELPNWVFIDETIILTANAQSITDPVFTYYVKTPAAEEYIIAENPYQPATLGTYLFRVEAAESDSPENIIATNEASVLVKEIPEPIVIKVKVPEEWTSTISIYNWNNYIEGNFVTTITEEDWHEYVFERVDTINIIFVNGEDWELEDNSQQTVDIINITESTCYEVGDITPEEGFDYGKRTVNVVNCPKGNPTNIPEVESEFFIRVENNNLYVFSQNSSNIKLYTTNGQLLLSKTAVNEFSYILKSGIYMLQIDNEVYKVLVK